MSNETLNYRVLLAFAPLLLLTGAAGFVLPEDKELTTKKIKPSLSQPFPYFTSTVCISRRDQ